MISVKETIISNKRLMSNWIFWFIIVSPKARIVEDFPIVPPICEYHDISLHTPVHAFPSPPAPAETFGKV
jgi:hypothetical protein